MCEKESRSRESLTRTSTFGEVAKHVCKPSILQGRGVWKSRQTSVLGGRDNKQTGLSLHFLGEIRMLTRSESSSVMA